MIEFKHQIGKRILRDWERFGKPEYGSKRVENLAKDLEISSRDLWYCIQFARKYPELENSATPLQNLSWRKIVNEYLPEHNNTGDNDNDSEIPEMPKDTFDVIYADPPWRYDFSETESRRIEQQYPTMDIDKIKNLQIPCNGNAILFLWATAPKLTEALEVMNEWGFNYRTHAIWDKEKIGMGYWFRGQHELLLVGLKGDFSPPPISKNRVGSVFRIPRTKHSKKPSEFRDLIAKWYPDNKKIELFAREKISGWETWGNEN